MTYRELTMMEVKEVLRRLAAGQGLRDIARQTGVDRKTVRRYADAAKGGEKQAALDSSVCARCQLTKTKRRPSTF